MDAFLEAFRDAGPWLHIMAFLFMAGGFALFVRLLLHLPALIKGDRQSRRPPAALWWIAPLLIVIVGLIGINFAIVDGLALEAVDPSDRQETLARATAIVLNLFVALGVAASLLASGIALNAGVGSLARSDDQYHFDPITPIAVVVITTLAAGLAIIVDTMFPLWILLIMGLCALGCALTGLKRSPNEPARRHVADGYTALFASLFAVVASTVVVIGARMIDIFVSLEATVPEERIDYITEMTTYLVDAATAGGVAFASLFIVGLVVVFRIGALDWNRHVALDTLSLLVGVVAIAGVSVLTFGAISDLATVTKDHLEAIEQEAAESPDADERPGGTDGHEPL